MGNELLTAALIYADRGYSIIPCRPDKKPFIKWEGYQKRRATTEEVAAWWQKWPGAMIGIVTGEISGLFVVDCDTPEGYEAVQKLIPADLIIPMVRTPRGGWHLWFIYPVGSKITIGAGIMPGVDIRGEGGFIIAPPSVNGSGKPYEWVDGRTLGECPPAGLPNPLFNIIKNKNKDRGGVDSSVDSAVFFSEGRRDEDLFTIANALAKGRIPEELTRQTLDILARNCNPPFSHKDAEEKVKSAMARSERRDKALSTDVREWVLSTSGYISSTEIYNCLQLSTREERKNVSIILKRMMDAGEIERYGNRNGQFRRIETDIDAIDWMNCDDEPLALAWPFGIERLVNIYPRNIAVIAGAPNAGKTAFILNFIRLNMRHHDVHLFSSEGGPQEVKTRLQKFGMPLNEWKFQAWERSRDFADVVKPDAVNVIDYLELHDDFFKVGGILKGIQERLRAGFCLVALQKNAGRDEGLGGARGLEKPRLYLAMDGGSLKIVKGKSWVRTDQNPNGLSIEFKLVDGCKFRTESQWIRT